MQGRNTSNHYVEITVTSRLSSNFSIYIGKSTTPFYTGSVGSNSTQQITLNYLQVEPTVSESVLEMGIHLIADNPVNVYALNHDNNSSDVAVMYPLESLGTEYYTMCYTPHVYPGNIDHGRNSEFVIVASQDSTMVTINSSNATDGSHAANTPFVVKLNKGELYQVQSLSNDLTGSYITSTKPVAVYSGSLSTTIPYESPNGGWDHMYEQMPPLIAWGREFYTVPLAGRSKDYFRILASHDSTQIYIGTSKKLLNKGKFYEFTLSSATRIFSDKPIMMAQFSQSKSNDNVTNGDGFMVILSPVSQVKNDVTFVAYQSTLMKTYYVNIVVPISEIGNIELAGGLLPSGNFTPYGNGKFAYAVQPISQGPWRLRDINPDRGFIAYVYGYGGNEAYGYGVGFNLDLVLDIGKSIDFEGDTLALCQGSLLKIDAGPYFDFYKWNTSDTTQEITVTKEGEYSLTASTIDGCVQSDSIYVLVSDPKISIGKDMSGCAPYSVQLDGGKGFESYLWNTGETTPSIRVDSTGEFSVVAYDKYGCSARDTMEMTVYPVPTVQIPESLHFCGSKTGQVEMNISGTDETVWQKGTFKWETNQPSKLTFKDSSFTSTIFSVTEWGNYKIYYTLTTVNGCVIKDTVSVGLFQIPTSEIITRKPGTCGDYNREIVYSGNASSAADFYWDYGGLALISDIDWKTKLVSLGVINSNPFVSLYVEENGCHSDTTRLPVGATPDFTMNTQKSRGCDSATIYFSGKLNIPDPHLQFVWNFGDSSADSISYLQLPSHQYSSIGSYDVSLLITNTITGCKVGFTVDDMVKIFPTPTAIMSVDPTVCYGDTIPVIYTSNIDSSLCYWQFSGAHQYGKGNDSIKVIIDDPFAKIDLQVEEYGCKSKWIETTLKRKPNFDFVAIPPEGCQPLEVDLQSVRADSLLDYTWMTDTMIVTGSDVRLLYVRPGKFPVSLAAYSTETGCRDTVKKTDYIWVHPKPTSQFSVDYPVAILGQSKLSFTDQSLLAEKFTWDFADGASSTDKDPQHNYTKRGLFLVQEIVESGFGCRDTSEFQVEIVSLDVYTPNAFRPASDIPENRLFMPVSHGIDASRFHLQIFNRWGEMVFESTTPQNKWDGKLKNGHEAPMGNYVWKVDYRDIQGFNHQQNGQVLLIR